MNESEKQFELARECLLKDFYKLCDKYREDIPVYEFANITIGASTNILLIAAPNKTLAFRTILACVENGIQTYEKENRTKERK